ncbi:PKC-interacting cousin related protein [Cyclospora cayetanensis]|uniref:PKC-interacting cousin related protein n=1 Tax=Cyclospora cayetanensis TaxID=88456 RepID=A0A1D3CTB8_9EIME|nr:PKC-interacting cousin related protein [Cyclospora cayetanensis]
MPICWRRYIGNVAEWLRRCPAKALGSARVASPGIRGSLAVSPSTGGANLLLPPDESNSRSAVSREALDRVAELVKNNELFAFIKGSPEEPQCGFSRVVIQVLRACGVTSIPYQDVLLDPELRAAVRVYGQWETFPQVYIHQELIGGADILLDMFKKQTLQELLQKHSLVQEDSAHP